MSRGWVPCLLLKSLLTQALSREGFHPQQAAIHLLSQVLHPESFPSLGCPSVRPYCQAGFTLTHTVTRAQTRTRLPGFESWISIYHANLNLCLGFLIYKKIPAAKCFGEDLTRKRTQLLTGGSDPWCVTWT